MVAWGESRDRKRLEHEYPAYYRLSPCQVGCEPYISHRAQQAPARAAVDSARAGPKATNRAERKSMTAKWP